MSRRRLLLGAGLVLLLVAGFAEWLLWPTTPAPTPGVTWENFHRLRQGMSARDVEALLGEPYRQSKARWDSNPRVREVRRWRGDNFFIIILAFDAGQRLEEGIAGREEGPRDSDPAFVPVPPPESPLDRIRRLLHW